MLSQEKNQLILLIVVKRYSKLNKSEFLFGRVDGETDFGYLNDNYSSDGFMLLAVARTKQTYSRRIWLLTRVGEFNY